MKLQAKAYVRRSLSMVPARTPLMYDGYSCVKVSSKLIMSDKGKLFNVPANCQVMVKAK
jgi:hypothetical protein